MVVNKIAVQVKATTQVTTTSSRGFRKPAARSMTRQVSQGFTSHTYLKQESMKGSLSKSDDTNKVRMHKPMIDKKPWLLKRSTTGASKDSNSDNNRSTQGIPHWANNLSSIPSLNHNTFHPSQIKKVQAKCSQRNHKHKVRTSHTTASLKWSNFKPMTQSWPLNDSKSDAITERLNSIIVSWRHQLSFYLSST